MQEEEVGGLLELSRVKPVPLQKTLLLVNNFVTNTTRFLNHFSTACEEKLLVVSEKVTQLEIGLAMIEAKLRSVPELQHDEALSNGGAAATVPEEPAAPMQAQPPPPPPPPSSEALPPPPPLPPSPEVAASSSSSAEPSTGQEAPRAPSEEDVSPPDDGTMIRISEHPEYAGFFKMVRVGVPDPLVRSKMGMLGLDPAVLDDPNQLVPVPEGEGGDQGEV